MEKYNRFLRNIAELIEKGLFTSKDIKKELENLIKFNIENIKNRLDVVSREEFEIQKKMIEKIKKELIAIKKTKRQKKSNYKVKKARKS
tara:strand:+ start:895 stop:1161 length:267 start_codon:yes stop_codon:yes gene_type:complete